MFATYFCPLGQILYSFTLQVLVVSMPRIKSTLNSLFFKTLPHTSADIATIRQTFSTNFHSQIGGYVANIILESTYMNRLF